MPKTWKQKLDGAKPAHVETLTKPFGGAPAGARMLIATPRLVEAYMRNAPPGETRTVAKMREDLAKKHKADITCPLSTAIFARIAAEAALEDMAEGKPVNDVTPFWRVIDEKSPIAKRLSCGPDFIEMRRRLEGAG
jgi:hypothetical protein